MCQVDAAGNGDGLPPHSCFGLMGLQSSARDTANPIKNKHPKSPTVLQATEKKSCRKNRKSGPWKT